MTTGDEQRFWMKVRRSGEDDCWMWVGARISAGYGHMGLDGRTELAHRIAWMIHYGSIPPGFYVCHSCDNPICCNPAHLFLGTPSDNAQDKSGKGRATGQKLTPNQVSEIREALLAGTSIDILAVQYRVNPTTIRRLRNGETWRHVTA